MDKIDWNKIKEKLPTSKSKEDQAKRLKMFRQFDPDGNGFLSSAEVNKAIRRVLNIDEQVFDVKPAIDKAFSIAKDSKPSKGKLRDVMNEADENIEIGEFKFFLLSLRQYFEYYVAFARLDTDSDQKITLEEFESAQDRMEAWVGKIDAQKCFKKIDKKNLGYIHFDEFCKWAIKKNLDLEVADSNAEDGSS